MRVCANLWRLVFAAACLKKPDLPGFSGICRDFAEFSGIFVDFSGIFVGFSGIWRDYNGIFVGFSGI